MEEVVEDGGGGGGGWWWWPLMWWSPGSGSGITLQVARHLRRALLPLVRHVCLVVVLLLDALRQVDRERAVGAAAPVLAAKLVERSSPLSVKLASEFAWSCSLALSCSVRSSPRATIASMSSSSSSPPFELKTASRLKEGVCGERQRIAPNCADCARIAPELRQNARIAQNCAQSDHAEHLSFDCCVREAGTTSCGLRRGAVGAPGPAGSRRRRGTCRRRSGVRRRRCGPCAARCCVGPRRVPYSFRCARSMIISSTVPLVMKRYTCTCREGGAGWGGVVRGGRRALCSSRNALCTCRVCPIRWARSIACRSICGFQSESYSTTVSAVCRGVVEEVRRRWRWRRRRQWWWQWQPVTCRLIPARRRASRA